MSKQLFILSLEPIESRYTKQWHTYLPEYFEQQLHNYTVVQVDGEVEDTGTTEGAFINFLATNIWKSVQSAAFFDLVSKGFVQDDAAILVTDFWNPVLLMLKYVKELMNTNWKIIGIAHAGMYDPQDFLGRCVKDRAWGQASELAMFNSCDKVIFATEFHIQLFLKSYPNVDRSRIMRCGLPFGFLSSQIKPAPKKDIVLFPHRIAPEKQHDIFLAVAEKLPAYEFITCQDKNLTKEEYHELLGKSKVVFSANLQETLGISTCGEAVAAMAFPVAPNHLSYTEILPGASLYPASWAINKDIDAIAGFVDSAVESYYDNLSLLEGAAPRILSEYFDASVLVHYLNGL